MSDNKGGGDRQYYTSFISCNIWNQTDEEYPYIAFYAYDESKFEAVRNQLIEEVLAFSAAQRFVPNWVLISRDLQEEFGYCLFKIHMHYPAMKVYAQIIRFSGSCTDSEIAPFPTVRRQFQPVFHSDWNVIYRDDHYTPESFLQVFTDFLIGQEPPLLQPPQSEDSKMGSSSEGGQSNDL